MKYEIQERICDECGKKRQIKMVQQFRATPFKGWIRASIEGNNGRTAFSDFCSSECAGKHFSLFKKVPLKRKSNATSEPQGSTKLLGFADDFLEDKVFCVYDEDDMATQVVRYADVIDLVRNIEHKARMIANKTQQTHP